ncbi:MAG: STAS domain-containing protein [Kiritimatiellae bacterium]|nr:STAS domain-containing protein [Kiritimatiellia bacterium]
MNTSESKQGNVTILQVQGKLDSASSPELDKRLTGLVGSGARQVVVNLDGLEYVSSAGLRVFLSAAKHLKQAQGKLALASPSAQVQQIFDIAGFASIMPIYKTLNEAVGACAM